MIRILSAERRRLRAVASGALAAALLLGSCTPLGRGPDQAGQPDHPARIVPPGTVTLRYAGWDNWYAPASLSQQLPVWQQVEANTGVHIKWEVMHQSQYAPVMWTKLVAGKDIPDLFALPMSLQSAIDLDLIEPLDDWIAQYAPNIQAFLEQHPREAGRMRSYDGRLYGLSSVTTGGEYWDPYGLLIRRDWLDAVGLEEPRTLAQWREVLHAFRTKDPNGNGRQDEIPLLAQYGYKGLLLFGNAVGLHLFYSRGYYPNEEGRVIAEWMTPEAERLVRWLHALYVDGLIDDGFLHRTEESILTGVSRDQVGVTMHFLSRLGQMDMLSRRASGHDADWMLALPPQEPGYPAHYEKYGPTSGMFVMAKQSPNKKVAVQWLDYVYASEEGNRLLTFGIEGLTYTLVDGEPTYTPYVMRNPDGLDATNVLRSVGAYPPTPWVRSASGPLSKSSAALIGKDTKANQMVQRVQHLMVDSEPFAGPTPEQYEVQSEREAAIQPYIDNTIAAFITGALPIDWDAFTAQLRQLGIEEMVRIKQEQYERAVRLSNKE